MMRRREMSKSEDQPTGLAYLSEQTGRLLETNPRLVHLAARLDHVGHPEHPSRARGRGRVLADRECPLVPVRALGDVATVPPKTPDRPGEHQRAFAVEALARVRQGLPHVVPVERQALVPSALIRPGQLRLGSLDELEEEHQMALADLGLLLAQCKQLSRVLPDRLEKQETALADRLEEAPVDQTGDLVEVGSGDDLRGFDGETAGEDGEPAERALQWLLQQLVAPGDRRAQRLLPLRRVASSSG